MVKKLMAILTALLMACTFICTVSAEEATPSDILTFIEGASTWKGADTTLPGEFYVANCKEGDTEGMMRNAYMKFDLSNMSAPINKVELNLYIRCTAQSKKLYIYPVSDSWSQDTITYENAPAYASDALVASQVISTTSNSNIKLFTFDLTEYVNKFLADGGKIMSLAFVREVTSLDKQVRIQNSADYPVELCVYDNPVYSLEGETGIEVELADHAQILSTTPDGNTTDATSYTFNYKGNNYFGNSKALYLKYGVENITGRISKATLVYFGGSYRASTIYVHGIENDLWTNDTLTWNSAFGTENTSFAPETTAVVSASHPDTDSNNAVTKNTVDVTDYVKAQQGKDRTISLALMFNETDAGSQRNQFISFNTGLTDKNDATLSVRKPYLLIETEETGVDFATPTFKIDGADSEVLKSGAVSANVKITNNMFLDTKATAIMIVYEGDRLSQINYQPVFLHGAATNGGVTSVTFNAGNITVSDKTAIKVLVWENVRGLMPVSGGFTFTSQGLQ